MTTNKRRAVVGIGLAALSVLPEPGSELEAHSRAVLASSYWPGDAMEPLDFTIIGDVEVDNFNRVTTLTLDGFEAVGDVDVAEPEVYAFADVDLEFPPPHPGLTAYQVVVLDVVTGEVKRVYDAPAFDLRYSRVLNGIGSMVLTLPLADMDEASEMLSMFTLDTLVEVRRQQPGTVTMLTEETYLTRLVHHFREEENDWLAIGGQSLNHLIKRRIVDPEDDPLEAGGYSTKDGLAHDVLRAYAREQMGDLASTDRQIPNLTIPPGSGSAITVGARLRYENLFDVFQDLAKRGGVDFQIRRTSGRDLELQIGKLGVDRTRITNYALRPVTFLTPGRGNLASPSLEIDRIDEKTFVYAQGQGQGANRILLKIPGPDLTDSPLNRIEFAIDSRSADKADALTVLSDAVTGLMDNRAQTAFTFTPTGAEPGNIYRLDWDVGDRITVDWGGEYNLRITAIEVRVDDNGEQISVTVENTS